MNVAAPIASKKMIIATAIMRMEKNALEKFSISSIENYKLQK